MVELLPCHPRRKINMKKIKTKNRQRVIAKKCGVSQAIVSYWLNMIHKPTGLQRKALELNFPELLERIDEAWMNQEA